MKTERDVFIFEVFGEGSKHYQIVCSCAIYTDRIISTLVIPCWVNKMQSK